MHTSGSLQELCLATGIICNMALTEAVLTIDAEELGPEQIQLRGPLARIQRLMVGLLPRYCTKENWEKVCWIALLYRYHLTGLKGNLFHWLGFLVLSDANYNPNTFSCQRLALSASSLAEHGQCNPAWFGAITNSCCITGCTVLVVVISLAGSR